MGSSVLSKDVHFQSPESSAYNQSPSPTHHTSGCGPGRLDHPCFGQTRPVFSLGLNESSTLKAVELWIGLQKVWCNVQKWISNLLNTDLSTSDVGVKCQHRVEEDCKRTIHVGVKDVSVLRNVGRILDAARIKAQTQVGHLKTHFPCVIIRIVTPVPHSEPKHLLWALMLMNLYDSKEVMTGFLGVDEETFANRSFEMVRIVARLKPFYVSLPPLFSYQSSTSSHVFSSRIQIKQIKWQT